MRFVVLIAALLPTVAVAQMPPISRAGPSGTMKSACQRPDATRVDAPRPARPRKLGEMPDARAIYTVVRNIDGCPIPVGVRVR